MQRGVYRWRWLGQALSGPTSRGKVRLILGARQTGKSSLLSHLAPSDAMFLNLQDRRERLRYERSPGLLTDELRAHGKRRITVCVDEIQKVPQLFDEVQLLSDEQPRRYEFFLTGSSARRLRSGASNLMPGRAHAYYLHPLIAIEIESPSPSRLLVLKAQSSAMPRFRSSDIEQVLIWGGLPGIALERGPARTATLETYTEVYLEEEIRREAVVRDVGGFARFLELAALESGQIMNLTGLSQESGVPVSTLRSYYQVLVDTFVGHWILPYGRAGRKRVLATPRFIFFDTGVRNAAARLPISKTLLRTQAGPLFEQWMMAELIRRASYLGRTYRVSTWRTTHGVEVDAVVETPREDIPVEAKWTENPRAADARHIERFLDSYPKRARRGFVVCRCPRPRRLTDRVTAIPWSLL